MTLALPELAWRPPTPRTPAPGIGLVGCGAITASHLNAYRDAGWPVLALTNPTRAKAEARRAEFSPDAVVCDDLAALLAVPGVEVTDVATHPDVRAPIVRACLEAGKHVLSQKPFVHDLAEGEALCALADARGLCLAVNQNGRWAPHLAWMREAVAAGLIGELRRVEVAIDWDHSWVAGTKFDATEHLVLFDFGVHWFDFVASLLPGRAAREVCARAEPSPDQRTVQPMRAVAELAFAGATASLRFDGARPEAPRDRTVVEGTRGRIVSDGPHLNEQRVLLESDAGSASPALEGRWFDDGFRGTMGELLRAIQEQREPAHGARANLRSLELCFAACASATAGGAPRVPGEVRRLPSGGR